MVVTRSVQLIVKKNTRQQKTLEGQLMTIKNGERTAISTRNAELDQLVPQYLGVSRAVLDSVIFCHQDESLWPMSEPSVLKKKFDEIFEALKYTKAIDNIKMLRKKQNEELGKFKLLEQTAKTDKDRADRAEKQSKELSAELDELRADVTQLHTKTKEAEENSREAWNQMAQYQQVVDSLKLKREKQAWYQRNLEELGKDLKERNESDEWLQSEVDQHEQRMAEREKRKEQLHRQYGVLDAKIKGGEDKLRDRHVEAGKYENQKASHEQQVEMRTAMIKDTARHHNIRGYDTDLDDMQINEYLDRISRLLKDQNTAVEKVRRETEREMKKSRDVLSKLGERRSALNEAKNSKKQEAATNDRRIALFQSELNHMEFDEGGKAILEANIEELEVRIRKAKENAQKASWDSKLDESETQLRGLEGENEQLNRDLVRGTKLAGELARLDHLKKEVTDRQRNLDKMTSVHNGRLRDIVGHDWQPSTLEVNFQKVHDQRTRQVKDAERKREGISRGLEQIEYKMSNVRSELKKGEKELASCAKRLSDAAEGEPEDYPSVLEEMQEGRDTLKADVDNFENERKYFSGGITLAHKEHKCKLCLRGFQGNEQKDFISRLEKKLEKDAIAQFRKELSDLENDLRKAKDAGPCYDTWLRLSGTEIPRLRAEEKRLGAERDNILQEIEEHDKIVNDREEEKRDAELLAKPVSNIVKNHQDMTTFSGQIQELTAKQNDTGISRTLEDIQEQMEVLGGKIRSVRKSRDRLTADKERARSQISTLELDLSNATNKLSGAKHQLEKKTDILQRVEDLRNANGENREKIKQVDTQLQDLAPQIAEEETKLDDIKQRGSDKERDLQQEASRLSESVRKLTLATQNIEAYFENGGPSKLEKCYRDMENAQQEIERIQEEQKQVVVSMNKIERELRDHDETRRTITDNIKYRRSLRDLEEVQTVIAELSAKNAEADQSHWQKLANHWQRQYTDLTTQKTSKLASAKAKDDQLTQLIRDWETDYKDAAYKFKKAHIEVEVSGIQPKFLAKQISMPLQTTKAAVEDLGRYGGALDK